MCAHSENGRSGGILAGWEIEVNDLRPFNCYDGTLLEGRLRGLDRSITILNCYAPYLNRRFFWDNVNAN